MRGPEALRVRLVRDAAQHDVVGQRREDDRGVPRPGRRRADDPHAGSARIEHSEGDGPRSDRPDLPDDPRRQPGARSGEVLAVPAVWPSQLGLGTGQPDLGRRARRLPEHLQRQHARRRDARDARRHHQRGRDREHVWHRRGDPGQQRSVALLGMVADRPALPVAADGEPQCDAQRRQVLGQRRRAVPHRQSAESGCAVRAERAVDGRLDAAGARPREQHGRADDRDAAGRGRRGGGF